MLLKNSAHTVDANLQKHTSCARSMDGCAPMNAPGAAIGRRPWAASCPAPKLGWVSTTVLPPSDAT